MMRKAAYLSLFLGVGILHVAADPATPVLVVPASNSVNVTMSPTLQVNVSEPGNGNLTVRFYGRLAMTPGPDFMIAARPDSRYYSSSMNAGTPAMFAAQADWIVANRVSSNTAYVAHLGNTVIYGDTIRGSDSPAPPVRFTPSSVSPAWGGWSTIGTGIVGQDDTGTFNDASPCRLRRSIACRIHDHH